MPTWGNPRQKLWLNITILVYSYTVFGETALTRTALLLVKASVSKVHNICNKCYVQPSGPKQITRWRVSASRPARSGATAIALRTVYELVLLTSMDITSKHCLYARMSIRAYVCRRNAVVPPMNVGHRILCTEADQSCSDGGGGPGRTCGDWNTGVCLSFNGRYASLFCQLTANC